MINYGALSLASRKQSAFHVLPHEVLKLIGYNRINLINSTKFWHFYG